MLGVRAAKGNGTLRALLAALMTLASALSQQLGAADRQVPFHYSLQGAKQTAALRDEMAKKNYPFYHIFFEYRGEWKRWNPIIATRSFDEDHTNT